MSSRAVERVRVKICGITNRDDAEMAIALGADALGFNTFSGSKRFIDLEEESVWISALPPFVARIAVMVNPTLAEARRVAGMNCIDAVQFHGNESPAFCAEFATHGRGFIKAVALRDAESIVGGNGFSTLDVLVDTFSQRQFGGTGELLNLDLAAQFASAHPELRLILAGGLRPDNVGDAVRRIRPYAVDVASGVERDPRRKDPALVEAFMRGVWGD